MPDLWSTLGYDHVAAEVATSLRESNGIAVIQGPPGVGKSWLAKGIGGLWEEAGGSAAVAEGDLASSDVSLYAFGFALGGLASRWKSVGTALVGVAKAGETLAGTAGLVTETVTALARVRKARRRKRAVFLGDAEQDVLHQLEGLSRTGPLLLIADNLHWWDAASLALLRRLRDPAMHDVFPFLAEMRVLAAQTVEPYQSVVHRAGQDALLADLDTRYFNLERVKPTDFAIVLEALGASSRPSAEATEVVYALCGGHLALARRCAVRLATGNSDDLLAAADSAAFLENVLTERLRSLGALGGQAVALLQVAAVLGLTFRRDELACASGSGESELSRLLRYCRAEDLLELFDGRARFVHDIYRQHFLTDLEDAVGVHERLSDCLRVLRPAEYDVRCLNALQAERAAEAGALGVEAGIQLEREGRSWRELPETIGGAIDGAGLAVVIEGLTCAIDHLNHYRFRECLEALGSLPRDLPKVLLAESEYLRAMCLMSTRSEEDRALGRAVLEAWEGYEAEEPELGCRIMQLLLYGLTHLVDKGPGRALEGRLRRFLIDRAGFDIAAKDALYTLDRAAGSLYNPDVSVVRNREAVQYFGPDESQALLRRPVEYYRCLVNYGASLIANAQYADAVAVYAEVDELVASYAPDVFPRLDYPRTNALLAKYRTGTIDPAGAVARQREISAALKPDADPFYIDNALAVYLCLAGAADEALALLDYLDAEIAQTRREPEPSMLYLIRANRAAVRFVGGDADRALAEWEELASVVDRIPYAFRTILLRRHELLHGVLRQGAEMSPVEFDHCLIATGVNEFGPLWDNFARGFRMPEVEFWREN